MPERPKSPCTACGALCQGGRCDKCASAARKASDRERGNSHQRGYTWEWRKYAKAWLRAHPLCGDRRDGRSVEHSQCRREGRNVLGSDVDHIQAVDGPGDPRFWDDGNHQTLCHVCHSVKTSTEDGGFGRSGDVATVSNG
jgi:5-methylcytosine-specific restriction protein A